jgi:hypothetical protein
MLDALKKGTFVIKLSDSTNEFAKSHGSIEKQSNHSDNDVLGRIVYQIKDNDGKAYDITVGAVSSDFIQQLMQKGQVNGKNIAKPTGKQSLYFNFKTPIDWTVNSMSPLTEDKGFKIDPKLPFDKLVENHPEIIISDPILSNSGKHAGKSFAIYTYNLFEERKTELLAELRNREILKGPKANRTTSVIYLDRVGYTVDDWMTQFKEWLKNPGRRNNIELFTGYMTSSRFVISMIEYYHSMQEGPKKAQFKKFLDGRIESKLLSSTAVEVSKTKENIQAITDWIEKNQNDPNVFKDWMTKTDSSLFNEEKFLKSSRKIGNMLKGKTAKDMYATLESIKQQIKKGTGDFGDVTE